MSTFNAVLNGSGENPAVMTPAVGLATLVLKNNILAWTINWSGISSRVTSVLFLNSMSIQMDAGKMSNQMAPYSSPLVGQGQLLIGGNQVQQLLTSQWSINIITNLTVPGFLSESLQGTVGITTGLTGQLTKVVSSRPDIEAMVVQIDDEILTIYFDEVNTWPRS